jgi:hypothetical protein
MADEETLHDKYLVRRRDGRDQVATDKHHRCEYFVLDLTHDPLARAAALTYAIARLGTVGANDLSDQLCNMIFGIEPPDNINKTLQMALESAEGLMIQEVGQAVGPEDEIPF